MLRFLCVVATLSRPCLAGPAFEALQDAAASGRAAALSSDPKTSHALASHTIDGSQGWAAPSAAPLFFPGSKLAPKPKKGLPASQSLTYEGRDAAHTNDDGWGTLATGALWVGIGMFALANPWAAMAWGAINVVMGASLLFRSGPQPVARTAGSLLLIALGVTALAAPPIGAAAFIGVGAIVGAIGLFKLFKGLFGKKS